MKKCMSLAIITITTLFIFSSCKKEAGPQGPPGNANVIHSNWFQPTTYRKDTTFGIWGFSHTETAPQITQAVLDSGVVLTFGKMLGYNPAVWPTTQVGQLPITITYMQGGLQNDTWQAGARLGALRIRFENDHNIYNIISNAHMFRYIIIPSGLFSGRMRTMSYHEICRQFNIPE